MLACPAADAKGPRREMGWPCSPGEVDGAHAQGHLSVLSVPLHRRFELPGSAPVSLSSSSI